MNSQKILEAKEIVAGYNKKMVLQGVSIELYEKEVVALIGPNGAGKSTLIKTVFGILKPKAGKIFFKGEDITGREPYKNSLNGMGYFIQGGEVFTNLTVMENLLIPQYIDKNLEKENLLDEVFSLFPELKSLNDKRAGILSGGERQMLALGILLMKKPEILLLDEPISKLAPIWKNKFIEKIKELKEKWGLSIIFWAEQDIPKALAVADRVYVMKLGKMEFCGTPEELRQGKKLEEAYFK